MAKHFKRRLQAWVRAYFGFSRTETNGLLILLPVTAVILLSEPAYRWWLTSRPIDFSRDARALDSIMTYMQWVKPDSLRAPTSASIAFFSFDPNTASQDNFLKLGLSSALVSRLMKYREKGGRFRKGEDLLKIYGFDSAWYARAKDWILIPETKSGKKRAVTQKVQAFSKPIDINNADSLQLLNVYGIGPALSRRIRLYRDRLGGFVSMEQLKEVYGLDSVVIRKLREKFFVNKDFEPKKINLNSISQETFRHPYVKWKESQAILAYRLQHGSFQSLDQLQDIAALPPGWLEKLKPYLSLE